MSANPARRSPLSHRGGLWRYFLDESIPFAADVAAARPSGMLCTAVGAAKNASCLGHSLFGRSRRIAVEASVGLVEVQVYESGWTIALFADDDLRAPLE